MPSPSVPRWWRRCRGREPPPGSGKRRRNDHPAPRPRAAPRGRSLSRDVSSCAGRGRARRDERDLLSAEGRRARRPWHRIDAAEIWHFHAGAPLALTLAVDGARTTYRLGADIAAGETPQVIVPAGCWQSAESLGRWTLAGCTVGPAFTFEGFELAPARWTPEPPIKSSCGAKGRGRRRSPRRR